MLINHKYKEVVSTNRVAEVTQKSTDNSKDCSASPLIFCYSWTKQHTKHFTIFIYFFFLEKDLHKTRNVVKGLCNLLGLLNKCLRKY